MSTDQGGTPRDVVATSGLRTRGARWGGPPVRAGRDTRSAQDQPSGGRLGRLAAKLSRTDSFLESQELKEESDRRGAEHISTLRDREVAAVCGAVRSVTLRPADKVPALEVELWDGTRALNLVWLGRRRIAGIGTGTYLRAVGRVTYQHGVPTIFNPTYTLLRTRAC